MRFPKDQRRKTITSERINPSPANTPVPEDVLNKLGKHCAPQIEAVEVGYQDLKVNEF